MHKKTISQLARSAVDIWKTPYAFRRKCAVLGAAAKIAMLCLIYRPHRTTTVRVLGFSVTCFDINTLAFLFREIFVEGTYINAAPPRATIIDAGANIGIATLFFKWSDPGCTVYAFEPNRDAFGLLQKNVTDNNLTNVHTFEKAIATHESGMAFYVDPDKRGSLKMSTLPERMRKEKVSVASVDLGAFLTQHQVDYLKLDVEGSEKDVLADIAARGILPMVPLMTIEYHHNLGGSSTGLSAFLAILERHYRYTVSAPRVVNRPQAFQDVVIQCRREGGLLG